MTKEATIDLEKSLASLEAIVDELESGDLPLEKAMQKFEEGVKLTRSCQSALRDAEQKVEIRIEREVSDGASAGAGVGDAVVLTFETALGSGDAMRRRVTITGVVLTSEFSASGDAGGRAKLKLIGVSSDGATDPVSIEQVG